MYRKCFLLTSLGLTAWGCAEGPIPESQIVSPPTQVTTNKPVAEETTPPAETPANVETPAETPAVTPSAESAADRVKREFTEAGGAIADWAAESKDKLVEMSEQKLAEFDAEIARLDDRAADLKEDAKSRWEQEKPKLEQRRQEFAAQLEELKSSSGDAWRTMVDGMAKAYADLRDGAKEAASEFEQK